MDRQVGLWRKALSLLNCNTNSKRNTTTENRPGKQRCQGFFISALQAEESLVLPVPAIDVPLAKAQLHQ